jgi:heme exporter protein A
MIEVRGLVKAFGVKPVLRGLDFQVADGEFVAVVGPNGAGKTTLLRILASLARPTMGEVTLAGHQLPAQSGAARRMLGVVSHQPLLYGDLTADQNLRFFGRMYGVTDLNDRIPEVLKIVGLSPRRYDLVREYSRGMQQRLAIGRGILHGPELLLFDEPHTGLDPDAADMLDALLEKVTGEGRTVVMTSHDLTRAGELASRVDILSGGKIARSVSRGELDPGDLNKLYYEVTRG